jgi:hypothetical protein
MSESRSLWRWAAVLALALAAFAPAEATTMIRMGVEDLVASNEAVVVGRVVDVQSYWNAEGSFILSDVKVEVLDALKGAALEREISLTVMGGSVGELTTLILAGPEMTIGGDYVLFLNREDLPGVFGVRTVRDLAQGIFDVVGAGDGLRAVSQASRHPLLPDARGISEAPGGQEGIPLENLIRQVRDLAGVRR